MNDKPDRDAPLTPAGFSRPGGEGPAPITAARFEPLQASRGEQRPPRLTPLRGLLGLAVVVFAALLFFLLTARSFEVVVNTETDATVTISGLAIPVGPRWLLRPGEYAVSVAAPGYAPWQETVTITEQDSQRLEVSPRILPGRISITSQPSGASVVINGEPVGTTPLADVVWEAGEAALQLSLPRYQTATETVTVVGREVAQQFAYELAPDWADITLVTTPSAVTVTLDENPIPFTPGTPLEVLSGSHTLAISAPGYETARLEVLVEAGIAQTLPAIALVPADGVLELVSRPAGANVTVDGEFRGQTPLELSLTPDRPHDISLARAGYRRAALRLALEQGSSERREVTLVPRLGEVVFAIEPADAELVIDGQSVGSGSQTRELTAVQHRVEVRKPGYASYRTTLQPREGLAQRLEVTLLTEAEARKAALQPEITSALGQTLRLIDPVSEPTNTLTLGAPRRDPGRRSNETLRSVRLERAFYIATTETTNAQFRQFLASHDSGQIQGNSLNREHQPVVTISWQQAARFCNWLSKKEGLPLFYREEAGIVTGFNAQATGYRLPTEAEWAFVARVDGENLRRFAWGEEFPPSKPVENLADNTSAFVTGRILNGYSDGHIVSAPVGSYPANHRGLYDIGGNAAEWVHDVYTIPAPSSEELVDPLGAQGGDNYTVRGASWALSRLSELRLTYRDYGAAGRDDLGFRVARYAE